MDLEEDESQLPSLSKPLLKVLPSIEDDETYTFHDSEESNSEDQEPSSGHSISVRIPQNVLIRPRSCYVPFEPPCPAMSEREALGLLLPSRSDEDDFLELQLDDFVVYCGEDASQAEMRSLNQLDAERGSPLFFNGVLSNSTQSAFVHHVSIHALPIGNYGQQSEHTTKDNIWLQSKRNTAKDIFYKLGSPAVEYRRFFDPFLWVVDLAKHVVDYLTAMNSRKQRVTIHHFRHDFARWLLDACAPSRRIEEIRTWMSKYPRLDYRSAVSTNIAFLYKEFIGALGNKGVGFHPLWNEVLLCQQYIPFYSHFDGFHTVVTRYIYECFNHLPFGKLLEAVEFAPLTTRLRLELMAKRSLSNFQPPPNRPNVADLRNIGPGDTISTARDTVESGSVWEKEATKGDQDNHRYNDLWFALVQSVSVDSEGHRVFEVIWYYRPEDTLCGLMKYPWSNELFLSDHCSCDEQFKIRDDEVCGVHEVEFGGTPETLKEFFCRQMYLAEDRAWLSLTQAQLRCSHHAGDAPVLDGAEYCVGDTVLVHLVRSSGVCEPCEIIATEEEFGYCVFRKLPRRRMIDSTASNAPPNEVVYTEETVRARRLHIVGRCKIRWFPVNEPIPTPYDRAGVGAFFFFSHRKEPGYIISPLKEAPPSLKQSYDPREDCVPKLKGLDLFCGGGNFGRGLEEGGAVTMKWANDMDSKALHTYMANSSHGGQVAPFLGSIDDFQRLAIQGRFENNVPQIGEVDFISGGSPCPGFSILTNDKTTDQQRKNQSLVAAFASCVDLYKPKYGVLENVVGIIQKHRNRDQDVFSQLMCALVGMGYQARLFLLDALACGSAQVRSRVFIIFAAPGWQLPETPLQTHSYPANAKNLGLGRLPTGEPMAKRKMAKSTPFTYRTAARALVGLPKIYDAKPDICVPFPDHRVVSYTNTSAMRKRIHLIPKFPRGMNFSQAWYGRYNTKHRSAGRGVLTQSERSAFLPCHGNAMVTSIKTNAYGRQPPNQPMSTIVTRPSPRDAKQGRMIHWNEDRCLSIVEAKRAQGFLDEEILLGPTATQWKIIGNSVAREVSLALGVVIADAVMRSYGGNFRALEEAEEEAMVERSPYWEAAPSRGSGGVGYPRDERADEPGSDGATATRK